MAAAGAAGEVAATPAKKKRRTGLVILAAVVAAVLLIGGGTAIGMSVANKGSSNNQAGASGDQGAQTPATSPDPTEPTDSPASNPTSGTDTTPTQNYLCWDGTVSTSLHSCGSPYQAADHTVNARTGLNWVFFDRGPRLVSANATCQNVHLGDRSLHRECKIYVHGQPVCLDYSQFNGPGGVDADYGRLGVPSAVQQPGELVLFYGPAPNPTTWCGLAYKGAKAIQGERWGVAALANSPEVVKQALVRYGQYRLRSQWGGVPQ